MSSVDILPLSTSAYLADTQHLSSPQHGAYLLILMTMWRAGGWIDNDSKKLANICKLSVPKWLKIAEPVLALLTIRDGKVSQKRLLSEIDSELKRISQNRQNGGAGGRAKALKNKSLDVATATISQPHPPQVRQECEVSTLHPSSTLFQDTQIQKKERKSGRGISLPADWQPTAIDISYGERLGLIPEQVASMAEDMRLWARGNSNRAVCRKADWTATFHNWMRRESRRVMRNGQTGSTRGNGWAQMILADHDEVR